MFFSILFIISEVKATGINEKYDKKIDWFISAQPKSFVLNVMFVIKDALAYESTATEPTKVAFYDKLRLLREINPNFGEEIDQYEWKNIRYITKAMWRKYKNDKAKGDLEKFEKFLALARSYWNMQLKR